MSASIWIGALATLSGTALGGVISFALSRQQIRAAREQRAEESVREDRRRSIDRRLDTYSDFLIHVRTFRNAVRSYYQNNGKESVASEVDKLLRSANDASAAVFLLAGTVKTRDACAATLRAMGETQRTIHSTGKNARQENPWPRINSLLGDAIHNFQDAVREELSINVQTLP